MKKLTSCILSVLCMLLWVLPVSVFAADSFTITYSAGDKGTFSDALYSSYAAVYGAGNVTKTGIGNLKIKVTPGSAMPDAPTAADVDLGDNSGNYYVTSGWEPTEATVSKSASYVVSYGALVDGVEYTVRYVDASTGDDLASPVISKGNVGDAMSFTAKSISGYNYDSYSKSVTLASGSSNILEFSYTAIAAATPATAAPATTTVVTTTTTTTTTTTAPAAANNTNTTGNTNNAAATQPAATATQTTGQDTTGNVTDTTTATPAPSAANDNTAGNTDANNDTTIDDGQVPMAQPSTSADAEISDGEVPTTNYSASTAVSPAVVAGISAAAVLVIALVLVAILKNKKKHRS